jgi:sn-glycerol 3-phosphate transport system permease protein
MGDERFPEHKILPYLLVFPSIAVIIVFLVVPFIQSVRASFYRTSVFGTKTFFVGLENYVRLFSSPDYVHSILITLAFSAFVIVVGLTISLLIALAVNQKIRGQGFYQVAFIWTYALSPAVAGTIWALLFAPATGLVPYIVLKLTDYRLNWMTNGQIALLVVSAAATWKMLGYNIVFYIAGLQNVPGELMEAARVDGAGPWRTFWVVTFPLLSPTTTFLVFVNVLYAFFQVFGLIDIMTQGGPGNSTEILVYKLYRDGFVHFNTGFASAQSFVLFIAIATFAAIQLRVATRRAVYVR